MAYKIVLFFTFVLLYAPEVMAQDSGKTVTLHLIETTDVHGSFFPIDFFNNVPAEGSIARASTYIKRLRSENDDAVILLENGDILQGQPVCYYYNYVKNDVPNVASELVNYLGYDAQAFGNHDIETGHAVYDKWVAEIRCPVLGANILRVSDDQCYFKPYTIIERNGVRVAVIGMLTPTISYWLNESIWKGMRFVDIVKSARYWSDYVREKEAADVVVGLFHSGWNGGIVSEDGDEDVTQRVAQEVPGFDIIFFGHDHRECNSTMENGVLCMNPSSNAMKVAHATITLTRHCCGRWEVNSKDGELVDIRNEAIDEAFMQHFQSYIDGVQTYVNRPVGRFTAPLHARDCYFGSAPFTDLIHNLQLQITGADISFTAPLSFDATIDAGILYMRDMFKLYRFENRLFTLRMTGEEIRKHLEMSYDLWVNTMTSPDDHIMLLNDASRDDNQRSGFKNYTFNFDSAAGIEYEVDVTKPNGQKVHILHMSDGTAFDEKKWYVVAMNSYRGNGGGELLTHGAGIPLDSIQGRIISMTDLDQRYYLTKEIERMGTVTPKANNNCRFVPESWAVPAIRRDRRILFGE